MSSVTPGSVAPRAPPSLAALRALVWLSEREVGAMKTSAAASAAATAAGGSCPSTSRGSIVHSTASAPARGGGGAQRVAERTGRGVDDHDDLLARPDAEALADRRSRTACSSSLGVTPNRVTRARVRSGRDSLLR